MRTSIHITKKKQRGLTLLELILVLVVASAILYAGINQYLKIRADSDILQLQANIDAIFSAMSLYHKKNCYGQMNPQSSTAPLIYVGTLNPTKVPPPDNPFAVNIPTDLVQPGFLNTGGLATIMPLNPIIDTEVGDSGYIAQFNRYTYPRYVCNTAAVDASTGPTITQGCANETTARTQIGTIIIWRPQIAIHLKKPELREQYLAMLNATCLSSVSSQDGAATTTVYGCGDPARVEGEYIVWERSPSYVAASNSSGLWSSNATMQQFNQKYTTYPINYLMSSTPTGNTPNGTQQYFLCGG